MSRTVNLYLRGQGEDAEPRVSMREAGRTRFLTREEFAEISPREPVIYELPGDERPVFSINITHNLRRVALAAGIYLPIWKPWVVGIDRAYQLISPLIAGLSELRRWPEIYRAFEPHNEWGSYEDLEEFCTELLEACRRWPEAYLERGRND